MSTLERMKASKSGVAGTGSVVNDQYQQIEQTEQDNKSDTSRDNITRRESV